jgi:hypothetical protein
MISNKTLDKRNPLSLKLSCALLGVDSLPVHIQINDRKYNQNPQTI